EGGSHVPPSTSSLLTAFDRRVVAFRTRTFALAEDLQWLDRMREVRDPVAVILHSARILEVLAFQALHDARLPSRGGGGEALRRLADHERLPRQSYLLLDRLRDLGNKARHVLSKLSVADAEQGFALALHVVNWYFCRFPEGPKLPILCDFTSPMEGLLPLE